MKDLQKMRDEFEKKIERERIANNLEERFGVEFYVFERFRANGLRILAHNDNFRDETISLALAKQLLEEFPADERLLLNATASGQKDEVHGFYHLCANRGFTAQFTSLKVHWLHKGNEYAFHLHIDGNEVLEQFFTPSTRRMDSTERETYKPTYRGHILREKDLPIMRFKCSHISYSGGHLAATDLAVIDEIISAIKNA